MQDRTTEGWIAGLIGMTIFSGSMPATKLAIAGFDPLFLTAARAALAGLLGALCLWRCRASVPAPRDLLALAVAALCVVLGFPLLSALALQGMPSTRSILFLGLLPLATATFGVLRGGERPSPAFWAWSAAGAALVCGFAAHRGAAGSLGADLTMILSVIICGLGYAEGGRLSRTLGGLRVICWALVVALPVSIIGGLITAPAHWGGIAPSAWLGLAYVTVFSMFLGFVFWYRGLALGGIAAVGQLQLLQPFLGFFLASLVLREPVSSQLVLIALGVVFCVIGARHFSPAVRGPARQP
ncbi:MAG: DMT family transporter [Gluconacetobacter sp.]